MKKKLVAVLVALGLVSGVSVPTMAVLAPQDYDTTVVITAQYMDENNDVIDRCEDWDGDLLMAVNDGQQWINESKDLHGTGDVYDEYMMDFADDSMCSDVYEVTVHTCGTFTKSDDWLECKRYLGFAVPVYENEED